LFEPRGDYSRNLRQVYKTLTPPIARGSAATAGDP
jgi:hypothetical protein